MSNTVKIHPGRWSEFITFGLTTVAVDAGRSNRLVFVDDQKWCEAHQCVCDLFRIVRLEPTELGDLHWREHTPVLVP